MIKGHPCPKKKPPGKEGPMKVIKNRLFWRRLFGGLSLLTIAFIFFNSTRVGEVSSVASDTIAGWFTGLFKGIPLDALTFFIRKLGHMAEFALLGCLISLFFATWRLNGPGIWCASALAALLTACCDEQIQLFIPGRSSEVRDIWVDFLGALAGIGIFWLIRLITYQIQRRRRGSLTPVLRSRKENFPW